MALPETAPGHAGAQRGAVHADAIAAVAETRGALVRVVPADERAAVAAWCGEWLQPQLDVLAGWIGEGATVVEAGSAEGLHAIALARIAGARGNLLLYERRPDYRRILAQNVAVNGVANATIMRRPLGSPGADPAADTIDDLRLARLDLIKVDEDDARRVLAGATEALARLRPALFLRVRDEAELAAAAALVRKAGYRCWRHATPFFRADNFNRRGVDLFAGRGAVALAALPEERAAGAMLNAAEALA